MHHLITILPMVLTIIPKVIARILKPCYFRWLIAYIF